MACPSRPTAAYVHDEHAECIHLSSSTPYILHKCAIYIASALRWLYIRRGTHCLINAENMSDPCSGRLPESVCCDQSKMLQTGRPVSCVCGYICVCTYVATGTGEQGSLGGQHACMHTTTGSFAHRLQHVECSMHAGLAACRVPCICTITNDVSKETSKVREYVHTSGDRTHA
jgi:hypothetical protein